MWFPTDIAEEKLFPDTAEPYKGKVDLVIDHHGSNDGFGKKTSSGRMQAAVPRCCTMC